MSTTRVEKAEPFLKLGMRLGEGIRWNADEQRLYWVDIEHRHLYRGDPAPPHYQRFDLAQPVGVVAFRVQGGLVMGARDGIALWNFDDQTLHFVACPEEGKPGARFNDGYVDSEGRFWASTMTHQGATSSLYRLNPDHSIKRMESGLTIGNGCGWSPDGKTMYLTDTLHQVIYAYDFDAATGSIENRRDFVIVPEDQGHPDGLCIDSEGFLWSCHYGWNRVVRYDPDGKIERLVEVPPTNVTCCALGGPDLTDLYITTAWSGLTVEQRAQQPMAGDIFVLHTDIKGMVQPMFKG